MAEDSVGSASDSQKRSSCLTLLDSTHLFVDLDPLDDLLQPIKNSGRIKYTCLAVCSQYIALGASTGSVYIFQKENLKYLLQLTSNDGSISRLAFSRGCKRLAVVTGDSLIIVWELNIEQRKVPVRILTSTTHRNEVITSLVWDDTGKRVFAGDVRGWVTITNIDSKKPSGLFKLLSELILKADSAIVQLDFFKNDLLVSTLTRCHICFTKRKKCATVGTKLRDGQYGACYWSRPANHEVGETLLLSARPGSRIWEVSIQGEVQKTHQFKKLLAVPPLPIVSSKRATVYPSSDTPAAAQSLVFSQLHPIGDHFLLAVAASGLYVLNPESVEAVFWTSSIQDVKSMAVFGKDVYCLHSDQTVCKYTLCCVAHCAAKLYRRNLFQESLRLCLTYQKCIRSNSSRRHLPIQMMKDLVQKAKEDGEFEEMVLRKFEETLSDMEASFVETMSTASSQSTGSVESNSVRLESGIHVVVRRRNDSDNSVGDHQDEITVKEDINGLDSLTEKSELQRGVGSGMVGAGMDETDHPTRVVVEQGEGLEGEQRSQEVITEDENHIAMEDGKVKSEVKVHVKDERHSEVKGHLEMVSQEGDFEEKNGIAFTDGDTLTSKGISEKEVHREIEENDDTEETLSEANSQQFVQLRPVEITGQSPMDTCQPTAAPCDEVNHSDSTEQSSSNVSSISKYVINSSSSTHSLVLSSNAPCRVTQKSPGDDEAQAKSINSELDSDSSRKDALILGEGYDNGEDKTDKQYHLNDDQNLEESSSSLKTFENDDSIPKHQNKDINAEGIDCEIVDEVFISSKEESVHSWVETSPKEEGETRSKEEGETRSDEKGGRVDEDHVQQENGLSQSTDEALEDVDSLVIDGNKVLYRESGFNKDKNFKPGTNIDGTMEVMSSDGRDMLGKERNSDIDGGRKAETVVLHVGQKEPGEIGTSPSAVPPFLRQDSSSTVEEDAKLIAAPTRLTEKSKKLKKSRKAARVVDIGTVMGQNAKNAKVSLKSPLKKSHSSPVPVSISGVPPIPPVMSPSHIPPSPNSSSPTRVPPSLQLSPTFQNGRDLKSSKLSPVYVPSILQPDENSGRIEMKTGDDVTKSTDGLANIGHSFKVVTRSLSQKLNKKSPLKRFKSLPASSHPTQEEDSILEVKVHSYSHHLKVLEEATEMARFQLNDQSICNDTETKKATLTIWLKVLQDVIQTVIKQEKQFDSDNTSSLEHSNVKEHASLTDKSISEGECEVEKKSAIDMNSSDPHSYVNKNTTESVRSQVSSPSATVRALHALEMEEELYVTCCHFVMKCFQLEIFQALDEEKVEADRAGFETELINGRQAQAEPLNGEPEVVENSPIYADRSHLNGEVQFPEEFPSNIAENVSAPTDMTPPNQGGALLSSTSELKLEAVSLETDFCVSPSSEDDKRLRKAAEYSQRSSNQQEVPSVLDVTMEMETERDQAASHFVWQYLPLLDTYKVRDVMDSWTVREQTFRALLRAEEEISDDSIWIKFQDLNSENIDDILRQVKAMVREKPVLAMSCLWRLQEMTSVHFDISDILHQCYPNIRMWEALQLCKNGEESNKSIVSYMTLRLNSVHEGSRDSIFQSEFQNMSLRRSLLSAALTYNCPDRTELFCSVCDVEPIPLSNHIIWPQEELIRHCINVCRTNENLQGMLDQCHHHGYWLGVVELLKVKSQRQEGLDMVLKLTDQELLCEQTGFKPQSFSEWHQVLQFLDMYLTVLQLSPWQHLSSMCVSCSKKMAEEGRSESHKECQMQLIQTEESAEFDKIEESISRQESDFKNEIKCSQGSGQEENCLPDVDSGKSKDCKDDRLSSLGNDGKHDNIEISESEIETSSKKTNEVCKDDQEETQKMQRKSSSSSPERSNWTEASPDHQPRSQLTWEYVAKLLVESVGAAHALKVLQAYNIPQGALTHDFYLKCLQSASIEAKQKSSQPGEKRKEEILLTMHPLLKEHIESEITQDELPAKDSKRWLPILDKFGPTKIHWGRTIDLNSDCQLCGWSLQSFKTDVCVYACGHTYHSGCTSGDSCVICVKAID